MSHHSGGGKGASPRPAIGRNTLAHLQAVAGDAVEGQLLDGHMLPGVAVQAVIHDAKRAAAQLLAKPAAEEARVKRGGKWEWEHAEGAEQHVDSLKSRDNHNAACAGQVPGRRPRGSGGGSGGSGRRVAALVAQRSLPGPLMQQAIAHSPVLVHQRFGKLLARGAGRQAAAAAAVVRCGALNLSSAVHDRHCLNARCFRGALRATRSLPSSHSSLGSARGRQQCGVICRFQDDEQAGAKGQYRLHRWRRRRRTPLTC